MPESVSNSTPSIASRITVIRPRVLSNTLCFGPGVRVRLYSLESAITIHNNTIVSIILIIVVVLGRKRNSKLEDLSMYVIAAEKVRSDWRGCVNSQSAVTFLGRILLLI